MKYETLAHRLIANSVPEPNTGCWLWLGWVSEDGYGKIRRSGQYQDSLRTTVAAWLAFNGTFPPSGLCVCHRCDMPSCVNPDHLFLGTHEDNMRDMVRKGRNAHAGAPGRKKSFMTPSELVDILRRHSDGESIRSISVVYGKTTKAISQIVRADPQSLPRRKAAQFAVVGMCLTRAQARTALEIRRLDQGRGVEVKKRLSHRNLTALDAMGLLAQEAINQHRRRWRLTELGKTVLQKLETTLGPDWWEKA